MNITGISRDINMYFSEHILHLIYVLAVFVTILADILQQCQGKSLNSTGKADKIMHGVTQQLSPELPATTPLITIIAASDKDIKHGDNYTTVVVNATNTAKRIGDTPEPKDSGMPMPILIASPAVAVCIVIFICITYKWHSSQLDEQAKKLAIKVADGLCPPSPTCVPCSPCRTKRPLLPPGHAHPESDITSNGARKKCLRIPGTPPPGLANKRGSSLSALSDQEVLNLSPARRHSTFVL